MRGISCSEGLLNTRDLNKKTRFKDLFPRLEGLGGRSWRCFLREATRDGRAAGRRGLGAFPHKLEAKQNGFCKDFTLHNNQVLEGRFPSNKLLFKLRPSFGAAIMSENVSHFEIHLPSGLAAGEGYIERVNDCDSLQK